MLSYGSQFSTSFRSHPCLSKGPNHGVCESVATRHFTIKLFVLHAAVEVDRNSFNSAVSDCRVLSIFADALHRHQEDSCDVVIHVTWTVKEH